MFGNPLRFSTLHSARAVEAGRWEMARDPSDHVGRQPSQKPTTIDSQDLLGHYTENNGAVPRTSSTNKSTTENRTGDSLGRIVTT